MKDPYKEVKKFVQVTTFRFSGRRNSVIRWDGLEIYKLLPELPQQMVAGHKYAYEIEVFGDGVTKTYFVPEGSLEEAQVRTAIQQVTRPYKYYEDQL